MTSSQPDAPLVHADPYRDLSVIDERAPRVNQTVVGVVALAGAIFGWPLAWALMALQLVIGLTMGRRWCLSCLAYFELIQPRIGEGRLEDSRAPRLANQMGVVFLSAAALAWWLGAPAVGAALGLIVAALALLAAATGFCAGCELYRLQARLRGISPRHHDRVDPADFLGIAGSPRTVLQFTHPLCTECVELGEELAGGPDALIEVDVRERPEIARKYGIAIVPTAVAVGPDGAVLSRIA
ncbi:MAG TPA: DUF4395 family protein [Solirubrobacterales bacterium]|nr:DUF4395 family protein [Solirubrobacterales bacterium]